MPFRHPFAATHYVLPRADIRAGMSPMVKEADFFCEQGGHEEDWGSTWIPVVADGLHHAKLLAYFIGSGAPYPHGIDFSPPNKRTVGEIRADGFAWRAAS